MAESKSGWLRGSIKYISAKKYNFSCERYEKVYNESMWLLKLRYVEIVFRWGWSVRKWQILF